LLALSACMLGLSAAARADGLFDGTKPLLCVSSEAFDCSGGASCVETTPESLNVPDLMQLDPGAKTLRALDIEQRGQSSAIGSVQVSEGRLVVSGKPEEGRAWTLAIQQDTGDSVLSVNDSATGLIVFGECTGL
jgi:hypothetical protein